MTVSAAGPIDRVADYTARFRTFLDSEVASVEADLATQDAGNAARPRLDADGRMHPAVWEARREVQRRSAKAGLLHPHVRAELGGGGFGRVEMQHVEEYVYRHGGLGLGLAALAWTEGASPAIEHVSDRARAQYLAPLLA